MSIHCKCMYVFMYIYLYINMLFIPGISVVHTATIFLYASRSHILEWNQFVQKSNKTRVAQETISAQASGGTPTTTPNSGTPTTTPNSGTPTTTPSGGTPTTTPSGGTPTTTPTTTEACAAVYGAPWCVPSKWPFTSCQRKMGGPSDSYLLFVGAHPPMLFITSKGPPGRKNEEKQPFCSDK